MLSNPKMVAIEQIVPKMPGYVYLLDNDGFYQCCNESQAGLFGLNVRSEIFHKTNRELPFFVEHPELMGIWDTNHCLVMQLATSLQLNAPSQNIAGHIYTLTYNYIPLLDDEKNIVGILGISLDLPETKNKTNCEQQHKQDLAFKRIIDNLPEHVYWKNKEGEYLGCNLLQAKDLGLERCDDIIGKTDYDLSPKDKADAFRKIDNKILSNGVQIATEEIVVKNGESTVVLSKKIPLYDDDKNIIGLLGISFDISERKKMEEDLRKAKEAAEIANQAKSEFLRNMEHQLRTPFSGVYSMVELLASDEADLKKKELLEITYQSAKEFLELLNDIIDFSRNQTESTIVLDKKFDLQELIKKAITMQRAAATAKHLKLIQKYPANIPSIWISDPKRIQRIVLNLLSNAIKFSSKGTIRVKVKLAKNIDEKSSIIQIFVTDMGIGIPADKQELIYEKFYRVSPANHNKYTGAGLGLHVVKELINDLEGEIEVISTVNEGTTFICTLPLKHPLIDDILSKNDLTKD